MLISHKNPSVPWNKQSIFNIINRQTTPKKRKYRHVPTAIRKCSNPIKYWFNTRLNMKG